jgi:prepilin peptidase dependent protein B
MLIKQRGLTMAEMMIALAVNFVILLGLISVFSNNISHTNKTTSQDLLNQQLESAMQMMANDIRRAGYWGNAKSDIGTGVNNNPFMAAAVDITVSGGNCILFAYDYNSDGLLASIGATADDEHYGYRLNSQTLQSRPFGSSFACTAAATNWENVTDPTTVLITALSFTLNSSTVPVGATAKTMQVRSVDISITGQLTGNTAVTKTLTQHVGIMNDKFVP